MSTILPLVLDQLCVTRKGKSLVGPIDLTLSTRGTTVLLGPNGAGKTSLLRVMHGLIQPTSGTLTWQGELSEVQKRQAFIFQSPIMLHRSVQENLAYPLHTLGYSRKDARQKAQAWAERFNLAAALHQPAPQLSGGEKQKLALARALITEPHLLFLDEPCASLDGAATAEIEQLLVKVAAAGTRLVMATHDMGQARRLADEVLFLHKGHLLEHAEAASFFNQPATPEARAFLKGDIVK